MILNKNLKNMVVEPNETINRVIKFIQKSGFNGVFVSNKDKKIIGIITDADIRKIFLQNKLSNKLKARDVMNKNFLSISQQENEEDYFKIMSETLAVKAEKVCFTPPVPVETHATPAETVRRKELVAKASVRHHEEAMRLLEEAYVDFKNGCSEKQRKYLPESAPPKFAAEKYYGNLGELLAGNAAEEV